MPEMPEETEDTSPGPNRSEVDEGLSPGVKIEMKAGASPHRATLGA